MQQTKKFLGLITRCKDELYIKEFCLYYLSQGVDEIHLIDDSSEDKSIYNDLLNNKNIIIHFRSNTFSEGLDEKNQMRFVNEVYKEIKNQFTWIISVDTDEFITTRKNPNNTIKDELLSTFKGVDCIKIPWVMMSFNGMIETPQSRLKENVYRWNHDKKHPQKGNAKFRCRYEQIEVKCIFKTASFGEISVHTPINPLKAADFLIVADGPTAKTINGPVEGLLRSPSIRESDIETGDLLCYHYRVSSIEGAKAKIKSSNLYKRRGVSMKDILSNDYPEVLDETLKNKFLLLDK